MSKRAMFVPMSWGRGLGPLTDCLAIANELSDKWDIAFLVKHEFMEFVNRNRYQTYQIVSPDTHKRIDSEFFTDFPSFQGLGNENLIRETISDEQKAIRVFKPDVIFGWLQFTLSISANLFEIPFVAKANWPEHSNFIPPSFTVPIQPSKVTPLFNKLLLEYEQEPVASVWELSFMRSDHKIAPTLPEFEPGLNDVPNLHFVGHLVYRGSELALEPSWMKNLDASKQTIYVYLSDKQIDLYGNARVVTDMFAETEYQVVVSMGAHYSEEQLPTSTNNVRFERLVPADSMLARSDVFVSSGTRGSTWNALLHGVGLVLFPGCDVEMGFNAQNIESHGAGIRLPDKEFFTNQLLGTIREVSNINYRRQAHVLGSKMKRLGGPAVAAKIIDKIAHN